MVDRQKAFILISNRDQLSEIHTNANSWHTANRIWACREPEFRFSRMKLCSNDKNYTTHNATIITTTPPALCGETWVWVCYYVCHVCLYLLFCLINLCQSYQGHIPRLTRKVTKFAYFLETSMHECSIFWMNILVFINLIVNSMLFWLAVMPGRFK